MRILITGGLGFIGSHLSKRLNAAGHEVHVFDRVRTSFDRYYRGDLCDYYSLENAFEKSKPQLVIHFGAMVSRKECEETPGLAIDMNAGGTFNVCSLTLKYGARLLYGGSSEEYGNALDGGKIVDESTPFGEPTGFYSMTKRMAEEIVVHYAHFKGLKATTVRFFMLYGPGEPPTDYRSALIRFTYKALKGEPLVVHKGTERAWCNIADAVDALMLIVERKNPPAYDVFNIGRSEPVPTEELAEKIVKITKSSSKIKKIAPEATIIPLKRASFDKIKKELGWSAKVPIEKGLAQVAQYMKKYIKVEQADKG